MSTIELIEMIEKLPADKQKEVEALVAELTTQITGSSADVQVQNERSSLADLKGAGDIISGDLDVAISKMGKTRMKFGDLKGFVLYMDDDFNKPMDEFKDYM